jgi:hypothetical protein
MAKGRYFRLGAELIVAGVALIALDVWLLTTVHLAGVPNRRIAGVGAIGLTMIISGAMVLLGY